MGVTGLWRLLEPAGKPVPLETLENKVLAVDISIWLHQMVKGFQDSRGASIANAHLLGLFQRLCKLLYYRIKPVFVFDGGFPVLKKQTILKRQNKKSQMHNNVDRVRKQLADILTKQTAVNTVISEKSKSPNKKSPRKISPVKAAHLAAEDEDLFKLPPMKNDETAAAEDSGEDSSSDESTVSKHNHIDLHSLDVKSEYFKNLTAREKHDLLTELKETRKQNSWGRLHELPSQSDNFSTYQMERLLKRRQVQVSLEEAEKEIGGHYLSLNELEVLLNEEGINTKIENITTRRIASDENARFLLIKDVTEAIKIATEQESEKKIKRDEKDLTKPSTSKESDQKCNELGNEFDEDLKAAIALSLQPSDPEETPSKESNVIDLTFLGPDFVNASDSEWSTDESDNDNPVTGAAELTLAKAYMLENSGLSEYEITRILNATNRQKKKTNIRKNRQKMYILRESQMNSLDVVSNIEESSLPNTTISDVIAEDCDENSKVPAIEPSKHDFVPIVDKYSRLDNNSIINVNKSTKSIVLSSDSDDSFEEVPEVIQNDSNKSQPILQLHVKPDCILEDDIFADIFQKTDKPIEIVEKQDLNKELIIKETQQIIPNQDRKFNDTEIISDNLKCYSDDSDHIEKVSKKSNVKSFNSTIEQPVDSNTKMSSVDEHIPVDTNTAVSKLERTETNMNYCEQSPKKGMTLNEIRYSILSQKEKETSKNVSDISNQTISTEELSGLADDLEQQRNILEKQQNKLDRMGRNISEEMTKDAQELLQLFGIPYIVAPMEAEAQCAFLESANLIDGTITDDSDIWLFGGKTVYKNFFNQQKYVLQYLSENIHQCFKLSRDQLILLALLVGSDYTTGVAGVGPVTAMEILAAFPSSNVNPKPPYTTLLSGLMKFRNWWSSNRTFGHIGLRNKLKNISLGEDFPSFRVVEAYLIPEVETSKEPFSWGDPDVTAIREFTREKFGWSQAKSDEVLTPILKRLNEKISQSSIRSFFRTDVRASTASDKMSARVRKAVERIGNGETGESQTVSKPKKPRKSKPKQKEIASEAKISPILNSPNDMENFFQESSQISEPSNTNTISTSSETKTSTNKTRIKKSNPHELKIPRLPERHQEKIPQREIDKSVLLKNKLKAIELFRTSKKGPGFIKKRKISIRKPKDDAELSNSSSD